MMFFFHNFWKYYDKYQGKQQLQESIDLIPM